jgi:hypothetical protein
MTHPSALVQPAADVVDEPGPDELDLLLAERLGTPLGVAVQLMLAHDHIAHQDAALRLQREYMTGKAEAEAAAAWAEAERDAAREQLAAERAEFAGDVAEMLAEITDLQQRVRDAETARDLAVNDLRSVLGVVELGLDAAELTA